MRFDQEYPGVSPYEVLGLRYCAPFSAVKKAYRSHQLNFHPDKCPHPDATKWIQQINAAYKALQDPKYKRLIDYRALCGSTGQILKRDCGVRKRPHLTPWQKTIRDLKAQVHDIRFGERYDSFKQSIMSMWPAGMVTLTEENIREWWRRLPYPAREPAGKAGSTNGRRKPKANGQAKRNEKTSKGPTTKQPGSGTKPPGPIPGIKLPTSSIFKAQPTPKITATTTKPMTTLHAEPFANATITPDPTKTQGSSFISMGESVVTKGTVAGGVTGLVAGVVIGRYLLRRTYKRGFQPTNEQAVRNARASTGSVESRRSSQPNRRSSTYVRVWTVRPEDVPRT